MTYLLDTNILLHYIRRTKYVAQIDKLFSPLSPNNIAIISVVSVGEIRSLALRNNWGSKKLQMLEALLLKFIIVDINVASILMRYAEIDAFSQGKLLNEPLGTSSRNMGKNDLWIAATASILNARLLTLDKDFEHLKDKFVSLGNIDFTIE